MTETNLTEHELDVLEMLAGKRQSECGAWVAACLEFLSGHGLCTRSPNYQITDAGRAALAKARDVMTSDQARDLQTEMKRLVGRLHKGHMEPADMQMVARALEEVLAYLAHSIEVRSKKPRKS